MKETNLRFSFFFNKKIFDIHQLQLLKHKQAWIHEVQTLAAWKEAHTHTYKTLWVGNHSLLVHLTSFD